jgi:hypothetical protein
MDADIGLIFPASDFLAGVANLAVELALEVR